LLVQPIDLLNNCNKGIRFALSHNLLLEVFLERLYAQHRLPDLPVIREEDIVHQVEESFHVRQLNLNEIVSLASENFNREVHCSLAGLVGREDLQRFEEANFQLVLGLVVLL